MRNIIWKDIVGYEGQYKISSDGIIINNENKIIKNQLTRNGYYRITLSPPRKRFLVHRLVLQTFLGNSDKRCCCHKDGNSLNNNINNLYWGSHSENNYDAVKHGTAPGFQNKGEHHGQNKLKNNEVRLIRKLLKYKISQYKIAKMFKISRSTILKINLNTMWEWLK